MDAMTMMDDDAEMDLPRDMHQMPRLPNQTAMRSKMRRPPQRSLSFDDNDNGKKLT